MPYIKVPSGSELFYTIPTCAHGGPKPQVDRSKPVVLLIHGPAMDARSWQLQIEDPFVASNLNIVTLDLPLVGLSRTAFDWAPGKTPLPVPPEHVIPTVQPIYHLKQQAEDVCHAIDLLRLPPVHLVSIGKETASAQLVLAKPEIFASMTLMSPANLAEDDHNKLQFADIWHSFLCYDADEAEQVMAGFYALHFGARALQNVEQRDYWYHYWATLMPGEECKRYLFGQYCNALIHRRPITYEEASTGFTLPVCIISGSDHVIHPTAHSELEDLLSHSKACPFFESYHLGQAPTMVAISNSEEVSSILVNFVCRVEGIHAKVADTLNIDSNWAAPYQALEDRLQAVLSGKYQPQRSSQHRKFTLPNLVQALNLSRGRH